MAFDNKDEDLLKGIQEALAQNDANRALYLLTQKLTGNTLNEELVVVNPDTGQPLAYLVPPAIRHGLHTGDEHRALHQEAIHLRRSGRER